jgi:HEAT repeats
MSRRVLLRAGLLLGAVLAGSLLSPDVRWAVWGWLRGEAFYRGRPASYWREEARGWDRWVVAAGYEGAPDGGCFWCSTSWSRPPSPWQEWLGIDVARLVPSRPANPPLLAGSPAAVPVLTELLRDRDPKVRHMAAQGLGAVGQDARRVVPALLDVLRDEPDKQVRYDLAVALSHIDPHLEVP